jgi:hypothetical protein
MLEGLDKFDSVVEAWFGAVEQAAQQSAAGLGQVALTRILEESPQYTGDFVGGWEVGFNSPPLIWRPPRFVKRNAIDTGVSEPFQKGDEPAIDYALAKGEPRLAAAAAQPLGTSIYLSNSAAHNEQYAWKIELGQIDFRPVNPNADRVVERAALFTERRFKHIGRSEFTTLRSLGV